MKETDKIRDELEAQIDRSVFGTNDPEVIRKKATRAIRDWQKERSTLGGYLRDIRRGRDMTTAECSLKAGVPRQTWQKWESNRLIPSDRELEKICTGMHFGEKKRERLKTLKKKAPENLLLLVSRSRPHLQAARGANRVGAGIGWSDFPPEIQRAIIGWGEENGYDFPRELPAFFLSLDNEEARQSWVSAIMERIRELD